MTNRTIAFLAFVHVFAAKTLAQADLQFDGAIPVERQGNNLDLAWAGGINFTQVSQIDLNLDGLKDLFFFERIGNKVTTLLNTGGSGTGAYALSKAFETVWPFPELHDWALMRDYNCDGKEDIFTYSSAGFSVYRNTSTGTELSFELLKFRVECDYVFTDGTSQVTNLFISSEDKPGFADVDGDGDLDVLTFSQLGSYVQYYKNLSLENYGTCDSLDFVLRNSCWGRFAENASTNAVTLNAPCPFQVPAPEFGDPPIEEVLPGDSGRAKAHAGSTVTPLDLNGDGVMDLLLGDISFPNLVSLSNGGTVDDSFMTAFDDAFPSYDTPTVVPIFPAAFYLDVNQDGKRDLLVSPNARSLSQNYKSLWYYNNTGTDAAPIFEFQQEDLFQSRMIDLGEGAYPVAFDHNGDGLMDLVVSNEGYFNPGGDYIGKLALFENIGSATAPAFRLTTDDYMSLSTSGIGVAMYPAFGDVDGDGDQDMYIGDLQGRMHFFRNTPVGTVAQFTLAQPNVTNSANEVIDLGRYVTPQFVDLDQDERVDLVVGEQNGNLNYLRNIGTTESPSWSLITDSLGRVRTNTIYTLGFSVPHVYRNDSGVLELLVGSESGWLWHYTDLEGNLGGTFTEEDTTFLDLNEGFRTALTLHDFTGDGELDMVVGNYRGGLSFWRSDAISSVSERERAGANITAYPNPTTGELVVEASYGMPPGSVWVVRNALGQEVFRQQANGARTTLQLDGLPSGLYLVRGEGSSSTAAVRVILDHPTH